MNKAMMVKCPTCEKTFSYYTSDYRPFCCEKCKLVDLGHWFKESYRVPTKDQNVNEQEVGNQQENSLDEDSDDPSEYL